MITISQSTALAIVHCRDTGRLRSGNEKFRFVGFYLGTHYLGTPVYLDPASPTDLLPSFPYSISRSNVQQMDRDSMTTNPVQ
jgi:hypothetical protein